MLELESGRFAGALGFNALGAAPELAFHQVPRFWGRGLMTEACVAAVTWAEEGGAHAVVAYVDPENGASRRLVQRLDFVKASGTRAGSECWQRALR